MTILVFNSGSSSLKFGLYTAGPDDSPRSRLSGAITSLGAKAQWRWRSPEGEETGEAGVRDHREAALWVLDRLRTSPGAAVEAIGHRVVHGGERYTAPTLLTRDDLARLEGLNPLAPLHNPLALAVIRACREAFGEELPMVAVFDTAFHATLPPAAHRYALPPPWVQAHRLRRYGFHGIAHRYLYERYLALTGRPAARAITFQLGNGCSACAVRDGRSVETSMGYTPLEGLIMSNRSGDVDPGVLVRLAAGGVSAQELDDGLNRASGLLALSGATADMRTLLTLEEQGHDGARLAVAAFCHRARKYLGAYLAVLGGADAVLFGGGIGENAPAIRERICAGMEWCGLRLDPKANAAVGREERLSTADSAVAVYAITVDEESLIARDTLALLARR